MFLGANPDELLFTFQKTPTNKEDLNLANKFLTKILHKFQTSELYCIAFASKSKYFWTGKIETHLENDYL